MEHKPQYLDIFNERLNALFKETGLKQLAFVRRAEQYATIRN